ncbi:MAG: radical SAM protein [Cellulosilyticum sp.]|nr:radical SAM protein [Cellulosilyticum sp.]
MVSEGLTLTACQLCPRNCKVNRESGQKGYCHETAELVVGRAALHHWEEPCISGTKGSGAVFFSGCTMGCVFCQNHILSKGDAGKALSIERLAEIFIELQNQEAHNINLVTPTHYTLQITEALTIAKKHGLTIPIIYNCSGYEKVETLRLLEGLVDVYLPDFKYYSEDLAKKYSKAPRYFEYASMAIAEMVRQVGKAQFNEEGMIQKGVIVRHLLLPGGLIDSKAVVRYLYETFGDSIWLSLMNQYTPLEHVADYPELNRKVTRRAYNRLIDFALALGVENGFIQEGETAKESFIPLFNGEGI